MTRSNFFTGFATSVAMLLISTQTGCSGTIYPPRVGPDAVTVYVTNYGRHSSLLLPLEPEGHVEWAYGDWLWFAENRTRGLDGIRALLFSDQATLGRRVMTPQVDDEAMRSAIGAKNLLKLQVPRDRARALMAELDARFARRGDTQLLSSLSQLNHVKDDEHYWVFHNCNHVVARWLRFLGAEVDGFNVQSDYKLGPMRGN